MLMLAAAVPLALVVRYPLLYFESGDYRSHLSRWYDFIVENGYFAALNTGFSDYNVPYLYLVTTVALLFPGLPKLLVFKGISIVFELVLAGFVYRCVQLKYREPGQEAVPALAALATLFAPTVLLNGALWGQSDAVYTAFLVGCLYYLLAGRQAAAFVAFGLAFAFKLQAVFLAPLFLWLLMRRVVHWRYFFLSPAVYVVSLLPARFFGRSFSDLFTIYLDQAGRERELLSLNAPNMYQWIPSTYYDLYPIGVAFTAGIVLSIAAVIYRSRAAITADTVVFLATFSVLVVPYFLPMMHERYFFPADVIAIVLAFYCPRYWYVPVVVGSASILSYIPFLMRWDFGESIIPLSWVAVVLLALVVVQGRECLLAFSTKVSRLQRGIAGAAFVRQSLSQHTTSGLLLLALSTVFIFGNDRSHFYRPGHHNWVSSEHLAVAVNLSPEHNFLMFHRQTLDANGRRFLSAVQPFSDWRVCA